MYILGISCFYHDSSAALLKEGKIVCAAEEERFTRKKHDSSFPIESINYCLNNQGITIDDISFVCFYEKPIIKFERILYQHLEMFPLSYVAFVKSIPSLFNDKLRIIKAVRKKIKFKGDVFFIKHHLAHAAEAFFGSPFEDATVVTIDGVGEWTTTSFGKANKNKISLMKDIIFPHSIGLVYSTITSYLGFKVNNSEYKVMGLSAYGNKDKKTNPYYKKVKSIIDLKKDGSYRLNMKYFSFHYKNRMFNDNLCNLLGGSQRVYGEKITKRHKDIASALQMVFEEVVYKIIGYAYSCVGSKNLVFSGGVALNSVCNGKILKNTPFEDIWISPNPSDGGTSIGAALFAYYSILGNEKKNKILSDAFLGPEFSKEEIRDFLKSRDIRFYEFEKKDEMVKKIADLIFKNNIVGWFQGRMEFGPRALGKRSILANPCNKDMRDILNSKVKNREGFRPFAPAVIKEKFGKYFLSKKNELSLAKHMSAVYPVRKKWYKEIPSVVHFDGTARVQTVDKKDNSLFYDLIKEFGKLSGHPILINTSFNINEEPIVCTPQDAYNTFLNSKIDYLVVGDFLLDAKNLK